MSSMLELPPARDEAALGEAAPALPVQPQLRLVPDVPLDFDDAVRRITPRLQRYARRRLGDAHEAEELVQEALLRAYKHGEALQTEDDLIAWCTVVTGRLVIDRLRVRGRSTSVAEVPEGTRIGRDTAEVVVARDEARMALDALDAMPARQAAVLWAREVEGLPYDEIGVRFGMTEPAVRSILTRARKALRKEYASRGGTLPVAGLAALAPWVRGLRWADRLRAAATRVAAPAAVGAVALGLIGGALHSPLFGHGSTDGNHATVQAVATSVAAPARHDRPAPALIRPATSHATAAAATGTAPPASAPAPMQKTMYEKLHTKCLGSAQRRTAVGDERCTGGGHGSRIYLAPTLPDNITGVRSVGVESDKIQCSSLPSNGLIQCQPSSKPGETR
jgi:RNA polymerase sigma-70 factor (ECF subfamily)